MAVVSTILAVLVIGHTSVVSPAQRCHAGTVAGVRAELLFGRNTGNTLSVSRDQFQGFLDSEVTPRFPEGFTVFDTSGQWHGGASAGVVREPSYALMIVLREASRADALGLIIDAYKRRFNQQSVLMSVAPTCFSL